MIEQILLYFYIYAFIGWVSECIYCGVPAKKFINRGMFRGPYCPIYGVGGLVIIYALTPLIANPVLLFIGAFLLTSILEYATSFLLEKFFHTKWWDYSQYKINIHGRVCLLNSTLFGIMGLFLMYVVHPFVKDIVENIPSTIAMIFVIAYSCMFVYDVFTTLRVLIKNNANYKQLEANIQEFRTHLYEKKDKFSLEQMAERISAAFEDAKDVDFPDITKRMKETLGRIQQTGKRVNDHLVKAFPNQQNTRKENIVIIKLQQAYQDLKDKASKES